MKKSIKYLIYGFSIFFGVLALLICSNELYKFTSAAPSSPYLPGDNPLGEGVENIFLLDTTTKRSGGDSCLKDSSGNCMKDSDGDNILKYSYSYSYDQSYINLLNYIDSNGNVTNNKFMDTFIIASCKSRLSDRMAIVSEIDNKIGEINATNNLNIKLNIMMGVCLGESSTDAMYGNGYGDTYNLLGSDGKKYTYTGDRYIYPQYSYYTSIYQMTMDITKKFYNENNNTVINKFNNVQLIGFYWMPESIGYGSNDVQYVKYFNDLVQGKRTDKPWFQKYNFKTIWIPYMTGQNRYTGSWELSWDSSKSNYVDAFGMCDTYGKDSSGNYINPACSSLNISHTTTRADADAYTTVNGWKFFGDELYMYGYNYGFNFVSIQSNYAFHGNNERWNTYRGTSSTSVVDRLAFDDYVTKRSKAGVEFELDPDSSHNGSYYGDRGCTWYKEWLTYALQKKWYETVNVYYIYDMFNPMYLNQGGIARDYYDTVYKYGKGTLTQSDVNKISCSRGYYSNYQNVSNGKSYESSANHYSSTPNDGKEYGYYVSDLNGNGQKIWVSNINNSSVSGSNNPYAYDSGKYCAGYGSWSGNKWTSSLYCDDGQVLTDGAYGKSAFSSYDEWVAFSYNGSSATPAQYSITIDLGSKINSLTYFAIELDNHKTGGLVTIGDSETITSGKLLNSVVKGSIKVFVSDSKNGPYTEVGKLNLVDNRNIFEAAFYELKASDSVSGRYVKYELEYKNSQWKKGFIFVSETVVGRTSTIQLGSAKTVIDAGVGDPSNTHAANVSLTLDNVTASNLEVTVSNTNVATASISGGSLHIVAVNNGTTDVTIRDKRYGTKVVHNVEVLGRYKISFNANGGTVSGLSSIYATYESNKFYENTSSISSSTSIVPTAAKGTQTFLGWYTAANGGSKVFNADGTLVSGVAEYTNSSGKWIKKSNSTLYAQYNGIDNPAVPTISGGATKVYNYQDTTLTCASSTSYSSNINKYYEFGYSTTSGGDVTWLGNPSTSSTYIVFKNAFLGTRYYTCRVYASNGSNTSSAVVASVKAAVTLKRVKVAFNVASNGGTLSGTSPLYVEYGNDKLYTTSTGNTTSNMPIASKIGNEFNGWYTAASSGNKLTDSTATLTGSAVSGWTNTNRQWVITGTTDKTLYAQYAVINYSITVKAGNGIANVLGTDWENSGTTVITGSWPYGTELSLCGTKEGTTTILATNASGYTGCVANKVGDGTLNGTTFIVGEGNATITLSATALDTPTCTISGGATKVYNYQSTTLTGSNSTSYANGVNIYYSFGYASSSTGTLSNFTAATTGSSIFIAKSAYLGTRYYGVKTYATDGTLTSSTCTQNSGYTAMTLKRVKISFNASDNNGGLQGTNPLYVEYGNDKLYKLATGNATSNMPVGTKLGYKFLGWYTTANGTGSKVTTDTNPPILTGSAVSNYTNANKQWVITTTGDKTLYARYELRYTVSYDCEFNGGIGTSFKEYDAADNVDLSKTCTKSGWTFVGWNTNKDATTALNSYTITENNVTLYGIYKKEAVVLNAKFAGNGATLSSSDAKSCTISEVYNKDLQSTTCTVDAPEIIRTDYTIIGYNTDVNAKTNSNSYNADTNKLTLNVNTDNEARTWYAQTRKEAITLTAKFNANGYTLDNAADRSCEIPSIYNTDVAINSCVVDTPQVVGINRLDIFYALDNSGTVPSSYNTSNGELTLTTSDDVGGRMWYAFVSKTKYMVILDADGGNASESKIYAMAGFDKIYKNASSYVEINMPIASRDGYLFLGWYNPAGVKIVEANGNLVNENVIDYVNSGVWSVRSDIVLHAIYREQDDLQFDNSGDYIVSGYNSVIYGLSSGYTSDVLLSHITTSGSLSVISNTGIVLTEDIKLRTGYKVRVKFVTSYIDYAISIKGDVLGTGELSRENALYIARHVIDKNVITGREYLLSADYNNDGIIKMNDVIKMLRDKRKHEENP